MQFTLTDNLDDDRIMPFLLKDERATIYHHPAWIKSICNTYNFKPFYLLLENKNNNEIEGIAPFVLDNRKPKAKKKIISLPFTNYCDFILPDNVDIKFLLCEINLQLGFAANCYMRTLNKEQLKDFSYSSEYLTHIIELKPTSEETYKSFGRRSIRRFIRKAEENNLYFRLGVSEKDLKIFYDLEVKLRKSIGLPPAPYNFFYNIWQQLRVHNLVLLPIVEFNSEPIAASIVLHFKNRISFEYTGLSKKHKYLYGNHKLHWEMIKFAHSSLGVTSVDLGRTAIGHQNLIFFKENWNAKPYNIYHNKYISDSDLFNNKKIKKLIYPIFKVINKHLPSKLLELEGKLLYKYLSVFVFLFVLI